MNATVATLEQLCGSDIGPLVNLTETFVSEAIVLTGLTAQILSIVRCDRILPIYTNTFFDGTCAYSITGVTWTFASFLVLGVMGMLMIMFRSSWLPTVHVLDGKFYLEEPVEGVEVEYEPHQSGSWVEGAENAHVLDDEQDVPYDFRPEVSSVATTVVTGTVAGTVASTAAEDSTSFATEATPAPQSNEFDSGHDDDWLKIDHGTTSATTPQ